MEEEERGQAFLRNLQRVFTPVFTKVKCGLCRKPLGEDVLNPKTTEDYGSWGVCHKSCVEQFEDDMNGG